MYRLFQILLLCSIPFLSISQSITELNGQIKQYLLAKNEPATLACYKQILILDKNNIDALCGASFMCSRIGNREKDAAKKKSFFNTAKIFAQQALKINSNYSQANYVMAVAMGRIALISGSQDKVAASRDIKKYADNAVKLDASNAAAWHTLGKYNYEVSNLNFAERAAAKILFGGLPPGDIKTAIVCFEKCKALDPNYIVNLLDLAKAYKQNDEDAKAKALLNAILLLPERFFDDAEYKNECTKMLKDW